MSGPRKYRQGRPERNPGHSSVKAAAVSGPPAFQHLDQKLRDLDGRGYPAYKSIAGRHEGFAHSARDNAQLPLTLFIDHVQGDPFAAPSRLRLRLKAVDIQLPDDSICTPERRVSTADFMIRRLYASFAMGAQSSGSGKSGVFRLAKPGQEVLHHSRLEISDTGELELRFQLGLPAAGRRILGHEAARLIGHVLPQLVLEAFRAAAHDEALPIHYRCVEDAQALRAALSGLGLVAFIADGAILPRHSGINDAPLSDTSGLVPFSSPAQLRLSIPTPHGGARTGMGIAAGVTLIVGGGYHGKSTLLRAIERGVYDHIPGDGREFVVTVSSAVKVRAEEGRCVNGTDISNFIDNLPGKADTTRFFTANASGSTSQAAAIIEALEVGATCLLLDEDTSAQNFMIRDRRMQDLVCAADEPITPLIDRIAQLRNEGVSVIIVVGGAGDYFDVADVVINMRSYEASDVTERAKSIALKYPSLREAVQGAWRPIRERVLNTQSLSARDGRRAVHIKLSSNAQLVFGEHELRLSAVEQIVDNAQTRAMALALLFAKEHVFSSGVSIAHGLVAATSSLGAGFNALQSPLEGELAEFRVFELAALLGRLRGISLKATGE